MNYRRAWLALLGVVAAASITAATVWRWTAESAGAPAAMAAGDGVDTAPSSRSMFPKVLNH
jgi:hypothetical protein